MHLMWFGGAAAAGLGFNVFDLLDGYERGAEVDAVVEQTPALKYHPRGRSPSDSPFALQQPGTASPLHETLRPLQWGDLNFLHTTDTHAWLSGHILEPQFGADWGDFVSFAQHMKQRAHDDGRDLVLVDSGDRTDGNGLGDATKAKGHYTRELFVEQAYDLVTVGNHELYDGEVTVHEYNEVFTALGEAYVASNVYVKRSRVKTIGVEDELSEQEKGTLGPLGHHKWVPMGNKYRKWTTPQNKTLLGFGFVFDFGMNDDHYSKVVHVKKEIKRDWFQQLVANLDEVDAIVVAGHIPVRNSPEFDALVKEIRKHDAEIPIVMFGGHSHIRDAKIYDENAWALQSGRYLETLGFASLSWENHAPHDPHDPHGPHDPHHPGHPPHDPHGPNGTHPHPPHWPNGTHPHPNGTHPPHHGPNGTHPNVTHVHGAAHGAHFSRSYLDFNRHSFKIHSNTSDFDTPDGHRISRRIAGYRKKLGLDDKLACVPQTYYTDRAAYPGKDSLFSLLKSEILPQIETSQRRGRAAYVLLNTGAIRFDLDKGDYTVDTNYIVTPYSKKWMTIEEVPRDIADEIISILNGYDQVSLGRPAFGEAKQYHNSTLTPGYVTHDDFGNEGDDTKHKPWVHHPIPNVIYSKRHVSFGTDEVDLVFEEFLTHFVVKALVELRRYRLIRPRFYLEAPLGGLLSEYFKELDAC